jgi:hypothetical protein
VARRAGLRNCVVWVIIIGGHALLIFVFTASGKRQVQIVSTDAPSQGVLILLDMPAQASASAAARVTETPQLASIPMMSPQVALPELDSGSTAITLPPEEEGAGPGSNAIDWQAEAERSARDIVEQSAKRGPRKRIGEHPPSPFREKPKPPEFPWNTEGRFGLSQGLIPYVHIGQRCVVGLGFFGCNLSKLPEANGHLFDGMKDPNRQRSSVPDIDTSSALDPPPD